MICFNLGINHISCKLNEVLNFSEHNFFDIRTRIKSFVFNIQQFLPLTNSLIVENWNIYRIMKHFFQYTMIKMTQKLAIDL